jgi:hypothetical protein
VRRRDVRHGLVACQRARRSAAVRAGEVGYLLTLGLSFVSAPLVLAIHVVPASYFAFGQLDA